MKILMITPKYPPDISGGGAISCQQLTNGLSRHKNIEIDVISLDGDKTQQIDVDGIKVRRIMPTSKSRILTNIQAYHTLQKEVANYDIFHTYNMGLMPAVGRLTEKYGINSVATLNGIIFSPSMGVYTPNKYLNPKFYRNKVLMSTIRQISHFTTLCPFYKDNWVKDSIDKDKITIISNMIDDSFNVINKNNNESVVRILFVGNYAKWRNLDILFSAYSALPQQNIELVIAGRGWNNVSKDWAKKTENKITYLGDVPYNKMPEVYSGCNIFIQPYLFPASVSRTLIEALQNELAVITTGNDYYSPIIRNMKDGILLYPMNADILAEKLQILIDDEPLRKKLGKNGKKRVYDVCSPGKIVEKYIDMYESSVIK